jgi:diguanylate cyclase (GGDEF)-like protein
MKIRSTARRPTGTGSANTTSPVDAAKAYSDISSASPRKIVDTTIIMGIPEAELTPKVRQAILTLLQEVDKLRRSVDDMSKRLSAAEQLADMDPLLPVYNRRAFVRELTRVQSSVERYQSDACLVYIDLDGFKAINDTYGHSAGDHVLHEYSKRLVESVRESDVVGRLGGDEFGVILSHTNQDAAAVLVNRLPQNLKDNPIYWNEMQLNLSMSYGVVVIEAGKNLQETMAIADSKMYQQKRSVKKH